MKRTIRISQWLATALVIAIISFAQLVRATGHDETQEERLSAPCSLQILSRFTELTDRAVSPAEEHKRFVLAIQYVHMHVMLDRELSSTAFQEIPESVLRNVLTLIDNQHALHPLDLLLCELTDPEVRQAAQAYLETRDVRAALEDLLHLQKIGRYDVTPTAKKEGLSVLKVIGRPVVDELVRQVQREDPDYCSICINWTLPALDPSAAIDPLIDVFLKNTGGRRPSATLHLLRLGEPALTALMRQPHEKVASALVAVGYQEPFLTWDVVKLLPQVKPQAVAELRHLVRSGSLTSSREARVIDMLVTVDFRVALEESQSSTAPLYLQRKVERQLSSVLATML